MDKSKLLARSLLEASGDEAIKIAEDLRLVEKTFDFQLLQILDNPVLNEEKKMAVMRRLFENKIGDKSINFSQFLIKEGQIKNLPKIRKVFERLLSQRKKVKRVEIVTANSLSHQQFNKIKASLEEKVGGSLSIRQRVEPELVGGILIRVGDRSFDNTLKRRISELYKQLV